MPRLNLPPSAMPSRPSNVPFTSMPCGDPFKIETTGQPAFLAKLKTTIPAPIISDPVISNPTISNPVSHALPDSIPTRFELFTSKEVDSGIIYAETPSIVPSISTPSSGTSNSQSGIDTPESSICSGGAAASISESLHVGATDQFQLSRLLADHFKLVQFTSPRVALVFVGNLPADMSDVELTWALGGLFVGSGVFVTRKVWHKPTALVQFKTFGEALVAVRTSHVVGGRVLRVVPSKHAV